MRYWLELHWYSHYYFWENWHFYYCLLMQYVISLHLFQFCFLSFSNIYYLYCSFLCCSCTVTALQFLSLLWMEYFSIYKCYFFFFFGHAVQHVGSLFPDQGLNPCLLQWPRRVLTTGLLGKSLNVLLFLQRKATD